MALFHFCVSRCQTPREKRPAPTRYNKQVETTRKSCSLTVEPPLSSSQYKCRRHGSLESSALTCTKSSRQCHRR
jgi:hypothetical protein